MRKKKIRRAYQTPHRASVKIAIKNQLFNSKERSNLTSARARVLWRRKTTIFLTMAMMNHNYSKYRRRSKKSMLNLSLTASVALVVTRKRSHLKSQKKDQ